MGHGLCDAYCAPQVTHEREVEIKKTRDTVERGCEREGNRARAREREKGMSWSMCLLVVYLNPFLSVEYYWVNPSPFDAPPPCPHHWPVSCSTPPHASDPPRPTTSATKRLRQRPPQPPRPTSAAEPARGLISACGQPPRWWAEEVAATASAPG